jgi:hypothetical protein
MVNAEIARPKFIQSRDKPSTCRLNRRGFLDGPDRREAGRAKIKDLLTIRSPNRDRPLEVLAQMRSKQMLAPGSSRRVDRREAPGIEEALWNIHEVDIGDYFGLHEFDGKVIERPKRLSDLPAEIRENIEKIAIDSRGRAASLTFCNTRPRSPEFQSRRNIFEAELSLA